MSDQVKFGTSGLRGLTSALLGPVARRHVTAFLSHLTAQGERPERVYLGRDLRASSPALLGDCAAALHAAGIEAVDCGALPTPALALYAMAAGCPAIMVTGSHIPADRNGLKFYTRLGEISKADEAGIIAALRPEATEVISPPLRSEAALAGYFSRQRYRFLMPTDLLVGWRIGVFEQSGVARDMLVSLFTRAGAEVVRIGRSETFIPVDTEAFSDPIYAPCHAAIRAQRLDAIVSTDGDGDRPLLLLADGQFVRGDALGLLAAQFVGADCVVTPVTSNSGIEAQGGFATVIRTRVGSPFVIAAMAESPGRVVVGFEANGGTLLGSPVRVGQVHLSALPTRDAILPLIAAFSLAARAGLSLAALVDRLELPAARSDRLADVPPERGQAFLERLVASWGTSSLSALAGGSDMNLTTLDGPRVRFANGEILHYRGSGNAPELRCYVEAATEARAEVLLDEGLAIARRAIFA